MCLFLIAWYFFKLSTHPVVVQNGRIGGHIQRTPSRAKLPHKVIARLDDRLRLADVL